MPLPLPSLRFQPEFYSGGASRFHLHIMAAVAEKEATDASERTKVALAAARARGTRLGTPANLTDLSRRRSIAARRARAADRHRLTIPLVLAWEQAGWSLQQMADTLTELRVPMPRPAGGAPGRWQYVQVRRLLAFARRQKKAQKSARTDAVRRAERTVKSKKKR